MAPYETGNRGMCQRCQINKLLRPKEKAPMEITTTAEFQFDKCCLDVVGPLPETEKGKKYILTFQYDFSKYMTGNPIHRPDPETIAREFLS
jgi:hypothetical protein